MIFMCSEIKLLMLFLVGVDINPKINWRWERELFSSVKKVFLK